MRTYRIKLNCAEYPNHNQWLWGFRDGEEVLVGPDDAWVITPKMRADSVLARVLEVGHYPNAAIVEDSQS